MATNTGEVRKIVNVEPLKNKFVDIWIEGITNLLMNKQSERIKESLRRYNKDDFKKQGKDKNKDLKHISDEDEVNEKIHYTDDGKVGYPAMGFKSGMMSVAPKLGLFTNQLNSVQVLGNIIPIKYKEMKINKVMGRTKGINKTPKEIIRPEFVNWSCKLTIKFNSEIINEEQLVNILNWAGSEIGLGDWRPERRGSYGMYKIKST